MSNYNDIALHYYQQIAPQMQGTVAEAFKDQRKDLLGHIAAEIEKNGPQAAASQLNALASFSQTYNGRNNPFLGDALTAMHEMITSGINPGTAEWRDQIQHMGDTHLLRTTAINADGTAKVYENNQPNVAKQASHPLADALAHQKGLLRDGMRIGLEEHEIERIENTISLIERDIQSLNPNPAPKQTTPDAPQKSPEALARQVKEDKLVQASMDRYDAQQAGHAVDGPEPWEYEFDEDEEDAA